MESLLLQLTDLSSWKIMLLASAFLLQGMAIAVFPEEVITTTLGMLWGQEKLSFAQALIAVWSGLLPANAITVFVGNRFGEKLIHRRPFRWILPKETVDSAYALAQRYGSRIIVATRFIPLIRGPVYFALGLSKVPVRKFMKLDALASCIQVPLLLCLGRSIGQNAGSVIHAYERIGLLLVILLGAMIPVKLLFFRKRPAVSRSL